MKKIKFLENYISDFKYLVENLDLKKFEKFSNMILSIKKKKEKNYCYRKWWKCINMFSF